MVKPFFNSRKDRLLLQIAPYVIIFLISFLLYRKSLGFDFIPTWDDGEYIIDNPLIRAFHLTNIKSIFTTTFLGHYAPFHIISYAIDHAVWGMNPFGYHLSNIVLHSFNSCLVYGVVRTMQNRNLALLAACLFMVHPVNVENVAWISERKTLLSTFFCLLAMLCYLRFGETRSRKMYMLGIGFFILAVFSKTSAAPFPLALALYELFCRRSRALLLSLMPFFIISLIASGCTIWASSQSKTISRELLNADMLLGTVYPTMIPIFWKYIELLLFPFDLSGYYDTTMYHSFGELPVIIALFAWLVVSIYIFRKGSPTVRFWYLWFWVFLLPVANLIPMPVFYADRYLYLPAVGIFVIVAAAVHAMLHFLKEKKRPLLLLALSGGIIMIFLILSVLTVKQQDVWRNELTFWQDTAAKSPGLYKPHLNLGVAYDNRGRLRDAEREYLAAVAIYPDPQTLFNLEVVRAKMRLIESTGPDSRP